MLTIGLWRIPYWNICWKISILKCYKTFENALLCWIIAFIIPSIGDIKCTLKQKAFNNYCNYTISFSNFLIMFILHSNGMHCRSFSEYLFFVANAIRRNTYSPSSASLNILWPPINLLVVNLEYSSLRSIYSHLVSIAGKNILISLSITLYCKGGIKE